VDNAEAGVRRYSRTPPWIAQSDDVEKLDLLLELAPGVRPWPLLTFSSSLREAGLFSFLPFQHSGSAAAGATVLAARLSLDLLV